MKPIGRFFACPLLALAVLTAGRADAAPSYGTIAGAVAKVFVQGHYSGQRLTPEYSRRFLANYLADLDPDHLYFTQKDIDAITAAHADTVAAQVLAGKPEAAFEIYDLYKKRAASRLDKIATLLKSPFDFASDRTVELSREKSPWPADETQADALWRAQIEGELLDEKLNGTPFAECVQIVKDRYKEAGAEVKEQTPDGVLAIFLNALARTYDPHSEYLRKQDIDDLDSDMSLSMVGIGVVVESDGHYVRIVNVLPGSPAAADGRIKVNDRIVGIAKGDDASFVDTTGLPVDRVLNLMRSKAGTKIRLKLAASRNADADRHEVELVSRAIDLVDDEAKAEIVERQLDDGKKERLGWLTIPSFYGDPETPRGKSLTRDVRSLVMQLKKENVTGIVIDLRNNPGGELEEAVGVGGLFLGPVPIVQEKDRGGEMYISNAEGRAIYDGPLVVVTDHMTASAAELFASALQDYGRAVIVGGEYSTYGKGSVQTIVDLGDVIGGLKKSETDELGAVQLTIAKFYRVNGKSTQLHGLTADISIPSPEDLADDGESSMKNPLEYDEAKPVREAAALAHALPIAELKALSLARITADTEFSWLTEDLDRERKQEQANFISLNEKTRRAEMDEDKTRDQKRAEERKQHKATDESIAAILHPQLRGKAGASAVMPAANKQASISKTGADDSATDPQPDEMRVETLNILRDLVKISSKKAAPVEHVADNSPVKSTDPAAGDHVSKTP